MNCVFLDRNDMRQSLRVMNEAAEYLRQGYSMAIFPESTRSQGTAMVEFKAVGLRIATKAIVMIIPVTIKGNYRLLEQNGFRINPAHVEVIISDSIDPMGLTTEEKNNLSESVRSIVMSKL